MKPQVTFASLSSPAVIDIRRLLALASDKVERGDACLSKKRANTSNLSKYSIFLRFALF